jgi:hypothetical protein
LIDTLNMAAQRPDWVYSQPERRRVVALTAALERKTLTESEIATTGAELGLDRFSKAWLISVRAFRIVHG